MSKQSKKTNSRPELADKKSNYTEKPLLSVLVPAYNSADFLGRGVNSLLGHKMTDLIEILVVNDGSKDETLKVAKELSKNHPALRVIDKENGGHGSTINVGIKEARGKYFRVMDADDYFDTEAFEVFLQRLKNETADIVLTDYSEDLVQKNQIVAVRKYDNLIKNQTLDLGKMTNEKAGFRDLGPLLSTTTCKTSLLKKANFKIDEKCFYVDMEYNFLVYLSAKTLVYYPIDVYRYVQEREQQSINVKNMAKNYLQHEKVCLRLLAEYEAHKNSIGEGKRTYLRDRLVAGMCDSHYYILLHYLRDKKAFLAFDRKLQKYPEFYNSPKIAGKIVRQLRKSRGRCLELVVRLSELYNYLRQSA